MSAAFIRNRAYLSINYIWSAAFFARQASRMEKQNIVGQVSQPALAEHKACVLGSITLSVAFLEATINEFLTDIEEGVLGEWKGLDASAVDTLKREFPAIKKQKRGESGQSRVLKKYEMVNIALFAKQLDRNDVLYKAIALLIRLRNDLIHSSPKWMPGAGLPDPCSATPS